MKNLKATTKTGQSIEITINENGNISNSDINKLNEGNFKVYQEGVGFVDYEVGNNIIRKTANTWLEKTKAQIAC